MYNCGVVVDFILVNVQGEELEMGMLFDFFGFEAYLFYINLLDSVLANWAILWDVMFSEGFKFIIIEWWYFLLSGKNYVFFDMLWKCY